MTTFLQLAAFARSAYGDPIPDPQDWTALSPITPNNEDCYGQAYKNEKTHEIIIAYRGTRPTNLNDLLNDASLTLHLSTRSQSLAVDYAYDIAIHNPGYKIITTGHSLGGNLAQAATAYLTDVGQDASGVVFNAPGIGGWVYRSNPATYNVVNLVSQTDTIHYAGGDHLGTELQINAGPLFGPPFSELPEALQGVLKPLVGIGYFLATSVGPGHSVNTVVSYLSQTNSVLGSEHWPPSAGIGQVPQSNAKDYLGNTLNFDVSVDSNASVHLRGANDSLDEVKSVYTLSGADAYGRNVKITNDEKNLLTYERTTDANDSVSISAQPKSGVSLSVHSDSYTASGAAGVSGQVEISLTYHGITETKTWNYLTGEYTYYRNDNGNIFTVKVDPDGAYRLDWSGSNGTGFGSRSSDGTYDAVWNGVPGLDYTGPGNASAGNVHINPDGSGAWNEALNGDWANSAMHLDLKSDGTATQQYNDGSTRPALYPASFPTGYQDPSVGLIIGDNRAPAKVNNLGNIDLVIDDIHLDASAPMRQIDDNYSVAIWHRTALDPVSVIYEANTYGDANVNVNDKNNARYEFRDGVLLSYGDSSGNSVKTSSSGALVSASTDDYFLKVNDSQGNNTSDTTSVSQKQNDGSWHTTEISAPGIYEEKWTENNIEYTKNVNINTITLNANNISSGESKKTITDESGKIQSETIQFADHTSKTTNFVYSSDNSYTETSIDNNGTTISHYNAAGKLVDVSITANGASSNTTYVYDISSGTICETIIKSTATNLSVTEIHFDASGHKTMLLWTDNTGDTRTEKYYLDGSYDSILKSIDGTVSETDYNANGDPYLQKQTTPDGISFSKSYFYDEHNTLYKTIEQKADIATTTTYAADGSSVETSVKNDGSYSVITNTSQSQHSEYYATDGHLEHESTSSAAGRDAIYYGPNGQVIHQEHSDSYSTTSKDFNADASYTEHYGGINGVYVKDFSASGVLLHSKGYDSHGANWETTYDNNGHELINKWTNTQGGQGETDHWADGSVMDFVALANGSTTITLTDTDHIKKQMLVGSYGSDSLIVDGTASFVAASSGNDVIDLRNGNNVVAYDIGDGRDTIISSSSVSNTLSLGGGITYDALEFSKSADDLVLDFWGNKDAVVFKDWYKDGAVPSFSKLQIVLDQTDSVASDPLQSQKFQIFDFIGLVQKFDQLRASNPSLANWHPEASLPEYSLSSNSTECLGGQLATDYANQYNINIDLIGIPSLLEDPNFAKMAQAVTI
jgi:hypothetical protein